MMKYKIAYCGLDCSGCPAYIAKVNDDNEIRRKTAEEWSKMFNAEIKPEDINCDGCHAVDGELFIHCFKCPIRKCALEKNIEKNCAYCKLYSCKETDEFFKFVPEAKETLDNIKKNL